MSAALVAGRRVRRETMLGRHPASVSSAAVDVARHGVRGVLGKRGRWYSARGEVAEGVLKALHGRTAGTALVNRRPEPCRRARLRMGCRVAASWDELDALLATADLVFVATSSAQPVLAGHRLAEAAEPAGARWRCSISAVPRNVEPSARGIPGVRLFDLDDLQRLRCPVEGFSSPAIDHARQVLEQEMGRLDTALRARTAAPSLAELHRMAATAGRRGGRGRARPAGRSRTSGSSGWCGRWRSGWCGGCSIR